MIQLRLSVLLPALHSAALVAAARAADSQGVATVWIGNPRPPASGGSGNAYLVASAGAMAAVTSALRIGLFLDLAAPGSHLRIAEDLAVLDNLSAGRIEYGFAGSPEAFEKSAALAGAWNGYRLADGSEVAIIPQPLQPWIPRLVAGAATAEELERAGGAGRLVLGEDAAANLTLVPGIVTQRRVALVKLPAATFDRARAEADIVAEMERLRARAQQVQAQEVMLEIEGDTDRALFFIGSIVAPALRSVRDETGAIVAEGWEKICGR